MFSLVSLLVAAALVSQHCSFEASARQIMDAKNEIDNSLKPNALPGRRGHLRKYLKIDPPPEKVQHLMGTTTVLTCEVSGHPAPTVTWVRNGELISDFEEDTNEIFNIHPSSIAKLTSKLVLTAPSDGDVYTCVAVAGDLQRAASTIIYTEEGEDTADLLEQLFNVPTKPVITASYESLLQNSGTNALVPCRVSSLTKSHVYWIAYDSTGTHSKIVYDTPHTKILPSGDLLISKLSFADMGTYTCVAQNMYGKDTADTFIYPLKPSHESRRGHLRKYLKIDPPPEKVQHLMGTTTVLTCEVSGHPAPTVTWVRNGELISDFEEDTNEIFNIHPSSIAKLTSKLVLTAPSDGDVYTCVAVAGDLQRAASTIIYTEEGEDTADLLEQLFNVPTKPVITASYESLLQNSGTNALVPCRVSSLTKSHVYWIAYDSTGTHSKIVYDTPHTKILPSGDLLISKLSFADMGTYTCVAQNMYGKDTADTFIYPLKPSHESRRGHLRKYLKIDPPPEKVQHLMGTTTVLTCEVSGHPAPTVTWVRNGELISDFEEDTNEIFNIHPSSIAKLTSKLVLTAPSDGDVYTCVAVAGDLQRAASTIIYTEEGEDTADLLEQLFNVPTKPVITASYESLLQNSGTNALVPCRVSSLTKSHVYWIAYDSTGTHSKIVYDTPHTKILPSGDLLISKLSFADMGTYTCVAQNMYGKDTADTFIYPLQPSHAN